MLQTHHLTFQYPKSKTVFSFPNISLQEKEHLLILGKSGIGKTTLLHLLSGLLSPLDGTVQIDNTDLSKLSNNQLDQFRGQHIGMVFQKKHAVQSLSVYDNLKARLYFAKQTINEKSINTLLETLDLIQHKNKKTNELSEGQLQRLGIASAVIHQPKLILADEPTSSLDDENCHNVMQLLLQQAEQNKANLIVITHDQRIKSFFSNSIAL